MSAPRSLFPAPHPAPRLLAALALAAGCLAAGCLGASCGGGGSASDDWPAKGMNLLLVTVDTTRADSFSCYGGDPRNTPRIDELAAEGVRFANAYSTTNVTKPAHLTILTGQRLIEHGVFSNAVLNPPELRPLGVFFKREGYRTGAAVAAIQLGQVAAWRGFDAMRGTGGKAERPATPVTDSAIKWLDLENQGEEPFFLWAHYFDPHTLYNPPPEFAEQYYEGDPTAGTGPDLRQLPSVVDREMPPLHRWLEGMRDLAYPHAMYHAEVQYMDSEIGRLFDYLREHGEWEDTVVVLIADHAEAMGEHDIYFDHIGLYEATLSIPFLMRVPGLPSGQVIQAPVTQLDVAPTLFDLFGLKGRRPEAGVGLRAALESGDETEILARDVLLFESAHNKQVAVRKGRWKLILPVEPNPRRLPPDPELYDLEADPNETRNLYAEEPEVVAELRPLAEPWIQLGGIKKGDLALVDPAVMEQLEALGYTDG